MHACNSCDPQCSSNSWAFKPAWPMAIWRSFAWKHLVVASARLSQSSTAVGGPVWRTLQVWQDVCNHRNPDNMPGLSIFTAQTTPASPLHTFSARKVITYSQRLIWKASGVFNCLQHSGNAHGMRQQALEHQPLTDLNHIEDFSNLTP